MLPTTSLPRRLLLAGTFAAAVAAAPAIAAFAPAGTAPSSVAACPDGESTDVYSLECLPDLVPNSPEPGFSSTSPVGGLPEVDNIPCTGANSGKCIGLSEDQQAGPI